MFGKSQRISAISDSDDGVSCRPKARVIQSSKFRVVLHDENDCSPTRGHRLVF
jgi:hypothetical protein